MAGAPAAPPLRCIDVPPVTEERARRLDAEPGGAGDGESWQEWLESAGANTARKDGAERAKARARMRRAEGTAGRGSAAAPPIRGAGPVGRAALCLGSDSLVRGQSVW